MARSRNIKPSIMDNEELAELEPITRLLFIFLWMLADREGRLEDRPKRIAAQALAYDRTADVGAMLDSLQGFGFITRYTAKGIACIQITAFAKHQTPHIREAASTLPEHDGSTTKVGVKHDLGNAQASPRSPDTGYLIPDTGYLIPDKDKKKATGVATPDGVSESVFQDFKKLRTAKKSPLTQTALDGITREATKAGISLSAALEMCCERGWAGFKAEWLSEKRTGYLPPQPNETVPSRQGIDPTLARIIADRLHTKPPSAEMREKLAALRRGVA